MSQEDSRRLRALFNMATDGIITIGQRGIISALNPAACTLFGYERHELIGKNVSVLMGAYNARHHDEYLANYAETGKKSIIGIGREVIGKRKDGQEFPLRLAVSEVELDTGIIYTGILHDLTDFHRAKSRVEQLNEELENKVAERTAALIQREQELKHALGKERELNELKSRFLSLASHEFKTPLSTILSSMELLELYQEPHQQPKREKHFTRVKAAIGQLTEVLDDFLSLSKLEQGKVSVQLKPVSLAAVIATSIESSEGQMKPGQEIDLRLAEKPDLIVSDPKFLRHIIMNLISNAAKYSEPGATITLETGAGGKGCFIRISDQGIGIPAEDQVHLFDRFFRARNVENIKGTGLGLNIVGHYVKLLKGEVEFTSEMGVGSIFTVWLPIE